MRTWLAALVFVVAADCAVAQQSERASATYVETPLAKHLVYRWKLCLSASFHIRRRVTADENAAAESALQTCRDEEKKYHDYWSSRRVSDATFARLKILVKKDLIKGDYDHLRPPN